MHSIPDTSLRPDDGDAFRQALRTAQRRAELPVVFGGQVADGILNLSQLIGVRTKGLRGLSVLSETGLGGRVLASRRPASVADYCTAESITHDYDVPVAAEGIRSVVAVPVMVSGAVRGVLYAASRAAEPLGDRATDVVVGESRRLAGEIATRDEVDRRLRFLRVAESNTASAAGELAVDEVRELHAELRAIAQAVRDDSLRDRLHDACRRLTGNGPGPGPQERAHPERRAPLSPREVDVLAQVALGCSNAEAGRRLSLLPETVKAYLRSAMRKLDTHTRFEAVVAARRRGLLP
ncbi:LuxR C-terminal-related transcriptional regulator [Streptomyces boluensis]|uniref:GAF domain-containing protein n=1 Tax=Streptomyces boluensis TaxID=1775135 RepID=A0A964XL93_9ACTN|nr:LuxR C-terminal-related transcriptional regulator [Streptomyces boluensis]NBE51861.1 GAF domain-containing protein [Streptomyces boluensis]